MKSRLAECLETSGDGPPKFTVTLPNESALDALATSRARLLISGSPNGRLELAELELEMNDVPTQRREFAKRFAVGRKFSLA